MRSSSGEHFIALDHVRALAACMVFVWHFLHAANGYPVPFNTAPAFFPLALFDEGHTGVALFMTLSGYLFAKLLDGRRIAYLPFLWNRALRLLPLLVLVLLGVGLAKALAGAWLAGYAYTLVRGLVFPTLPNGGWSITVEFHYYLVLPVFLWLLRHSRWLPLCVVLAALVLRLALYRQTGEIQTLAYWTIVGRVDQFALGMLAFQFRGELARRHLPVLAGLAAFALFYWQFDAGGGFYHRPAYPSPSALWIVLPTIEGLAYAAGIAWYDASFAHARGGISRFVGRIGAYSYSIYLLHFFVVFRAAAFVHEHVMDISTFARALPWALACFLLMVPLGHLSFRFVEAPFLKLRKRYYATPATVAVRVPA